MNKPIQVGDSVMVVKIPPCQKCMAMPDRGIGSVGMIFRVGKISDEGSIMHGEYHPGRVAFPEGESRWRWGLYRLKRIPPLSELESTDETMKETA